MLLFLFLFFSFTSKILNGSEEYGMCEFHLVFAFFLYCFKLMYAYQTMIGLFFSKENGYRSEILMKFIEFKMLKYS